MKRPKIQIHRRTTDPLMKAIIDQTIWQFSENYKIHEIYGPLNSAAYGVSSLLYN